MHSVTVEIQAKQIYQALTEGAVSGERESMLLKKGRASLLEERNEKKGEKREMERESTRVNRPGRETFSRDSVKCASMARELFDQKSLVSHE